MLMEKHRKKWKPPHLVFLDLEKVFEHVPHQLILRYVLGDHGVPEQLITRVQMLYTNTSSFMWCTVSFSDSFRKLKVGIHESWHSWKFSIITIAVHSRHGYYHKRTVTWQPLDLALCWWCHAHSYHQRITAALCISCLCQFCLWLNIKKTEYQPEPCPCTSQ